MNIKKLSILSSAIAAFSFIATSAQAVPWCWKGSIVQIADVSWNQSQILANFNGPVPANHPYPDHYIVYEATRNFANLFSGGGGGFGGWTVPGSGQVQVQHYAPYTLTNMMPGNYDISQGVRFKMKKCYSIPMMVQISEQDISKDISGFVPQILKPLEGIEEIKNYWEAPSEKELPKSEK